MSNGNNTSHTGKDPLENLRKRIYGRRGGYGEGRLSRPELPPLHDQAPENWKEIDQKEIVQKKEHPPKKMSYLALFLIGSGVLALITVGIAAWLILRGGAGTISLKGVEVTIDAPGEIRGGDFVAWNVHVRNKTGNDLETADLIFEYPDGARPAAEEDRLTLRRRIQLGRIADGEEITKLFEGFLFGEEGRSKSARATVEYRAAGSNIILANETESSTKITQAPLTVFLKAPESLNSGDEVEVTVEMSSKANDVLSDGVLVMQYPQGFAFESASPSPSFGNKKWFLGDIDREEVIRITIHGKLSGSDLEEKLFRAEVGQEENNVLVILFGVDSAIVTIAKSFLDFSYTFNDKTITSLAPGSFVDAQVRWKNNLSVPIENAMLRVRLDGKGYDEKSLDVPNGAYRGTDRTIVWNASSYAPFAFLDPGQEGVVSFRFRVPQSFTIHSPADSNFSIHFDGTFEALKKPSGFGNIDISTNKQYDIKIITDLQVVRKALYYDSILPGSGSLPPQVARETIYTVVWSLVNSSNDIRNVKVKASLPAYMVWKGIVQPQENIIYDSVSGEIIWSLDGLLQGTGIIRPAREVRFQVGFIPVVGDVGERPILISQVVAEGIDDFAEVSIRKTAPAQNTELRSDPKTVSDDWKVVP